MCMSECKQSIITRPDVNTEILATLLIARRQ